MSTRFKCFVVMVVLMVIDILPIPIVGSIALYVIVSRPPWFKELVRGLYEENKVHEKQPHA
jgi:hypothetical protein